MLQRYSALSDVGTTKQHDGRYVLWTDVLTELKLFEDRIKSERIRSPISEQVLDRIPFKVAFDRLFRMIREE